MGTPGNPYTAMKASLVAAMLAAGLAGARAQAPEIDNESKILRCRDNPASVSRPHARSPPNKPS